MNPVCLIIPPSPFLLDERVFVSLGVLKVAASLERAGVPVEVLDLSGVENYEEVVWEYIGKTEVRAVGITATTPQMPAAAKIARAIDLSSNVRTVLGGPHATLVNAAANREQSKRLLGRACKARWQLADLFDVLVFGDGEKAILEAIKPRPGKWVDADDPKGNLFLKGEELDLWPARHLVDMDSYHYTIDGERATSLIAQLGCPFGCNFCGGRLSPMLRRVRMRSTENVIAEMRHLYERYGFKAFMCYDDATEILTESRGFVRFPELEATDKVATLNPETNEVSFELPKRIVRLPFKGGLVTVKNRMIDLAVTPEHRMWMRSCNAAEYKHEPAHSLIGTASGNQFLQRAYWRGKHFTTFSIPAYEQVFLGRNKGSPKVLAGVREFPAALWVQFMAWYLSEGSCYRPKVKNGRGYRICIKQHADVNADKVEEIRSVLTALGFRFSYSSNQFHLDSRELYEYLKQFGMSRLKHVPQEFKEMQPELQLLFIKTYLKGDGHTSPSGQETICSYSDRMRDDLQEMAIKCGYWAATDKTRVLLSRQRDLTVHGSDIGGTEYQGEVHCVTVSTGVVLVRRNGKAVWCGNCYDDELNVNKNVVQLMNAIADLGRELGVEWKLRGFVKAELFTDAQAEAMARAGFKWLLVGFESGSPRILENINKHATLDDNNRCLQIARKHGIKIKALMSLGHAGESEKSVRETRDWLLALCPSDFDCTVITTYPGTPYYDEAVETGPGVWTFTAKSGDRLHARDVDFLKETAYYKGAPGEYESFVWTDYLSAGEIVALRDELERDVRRQLHLPYNQGQPGVRYESSIGQLPSSILRRST